VSLKDVLESLRPKLAEAAQRVLDEWAPDEEGWDEEFGSGGACDAVSRAMSEIIDVEGVEVLEGGHDGDDHSWLIVYDDVDAYAVDIPPGVYETGGGYSWKKIDGASVSPDDVVIEPVRRRDVVGAVRPLIPGRDVDFHEIAMRVAATSVEAARRRRPKKAPREPVRMRPAKPVRQDRNVLQPLTEYSCRADISLSVDFEGRASKTALLKKLKDEISAALRAAVSITAKDTGLEASTVKVQPIKFDCAVNDQAMLEESDEIE
jgi:hypothetical protein